MSPGEFSPCRCLVGRVRARKKGRCPGFVLTLIRVKAHVEHMLRPEGFCFRVRVGTLNQDATAPGGLPKWDGPTRLTGEFGENSPHLYRGVFWAKSLQEFSILVHCTS